MKRCRAARLGTRRRALSSRGPGYQSNGMNSPAPSYHGYRFPAEIIAHAVWIYFRFSLSFRDVEDLLAQRNITVTYETIRQWCLTFGLGYARTLRRRRGRLGDTWHLDELFVAINGRKQYLWRAVDEDGDVLDILVQSRRNRRAAVPVLSKAAEEARVSSPSARHRQAAQLPGGTSNRDAIGSPSDRAVCEQPSRGVASTNAAARAPNAMLQVSRPSAAVRGRPRRGAQSLPGRPTPASIQLTTACFAAERSSSGRR